MLGLIPLYYKNMNNPFPEDLDSSNITGLFISNKNNIFTIKKKKEHKYNENILDSFNTTFKTELNEQNTKLIEYGWLENILIYLLLVNEYNIISTKSIYNITNNTSNEQFCWKIFLDRYKSNDSNIYQNIINNNGIIPNKQLDYEMKFNKYNYIIKLIDIYQKVIDYNL